MILAFLLDHLTDHFPQNLIDFVDYILVIDEPIYLAASPLLIHKLERKNRVQQGFRNTQADRFECFISSASIKIQLQTVFPAVTWILKLERHFMDDVIGDTLFCWAALITDAGLFHRAVYEDSQIACTILCSQLIKFVPHANGVVRQMVKPKGSEKSESALTCSSNCCHLLILLFESWFQN